MATRKRKIERDAFEPDEEGATIMVVPKNSDGRVIERSKLKEIFETRPNFYGGEQPAEMMDKIRQLHKFYEQLRGLIE